MKDFLSMGYKKSQVSTIEKADILRGLKKSPGYPIAYSFNQAAFVCIGCELLSLGVSFRHVNMILFQLSDNDFEGMKNNFVKNNYSVDVYLQTMQKKFVSKYRKMSGVAYGKNVVTAQPIMLPDRLRRQSIEAYFLPEKELDAKTGNMSGYIRIKVYRILNLLLERT